MGLKMKILIAEDDFITRRAIKKMMQRYGGCDEAVNGQEAVDSFYMAWEEGEPYDLVFMDIMMPIKDGHQALQEIRNFEESNGVSGAKETKVIMLSALDDPKNVVQAFYLGGATTYLVKPVSSERIYEAIRNIKVTSRVTG